MLDNVDIQILANTFFNFIKSKRNIYCNLYNLYTEKKILKSRLKYYEENIIRVIFDIYYEKF